MGEGRTWILIGLYSSQKCYICIKPMPWEQPALLSRTQLSPPPLSNYQDCKWKTFFKSCFCSEARSNLVAERDAGSSPRWTWCNNMVGLWTVAYKCKCPKHFLSEKRAAVSKTKMKKMKKHLHQLEAAWVENMHQLDKTCIAFTRIVAKTKCCTIATCKGSDATL